MKTILAKHLKWYKRNPEVPTTSNDRTLRRLMYVSDGIETLMGLVCESKNEFWCFTNNSSIECMPSELYLTKYKTLEEAEKVLFEFVLNKIYKLATLNSDMPYIQTRKFKGRDRAAFNKYTNEIGDDLKSAFKCGMEWILRSEGFPRRPSWAKFLVQNRNGTFVWFELQPKPNHTTGDWTAVDGRSEIVSMSDQWHTNITRL